MLSSEKDKLHNQKHWLDKGRFRSSNFQNEGDNLPKFKLKKIQNCSRETTEFRKPNKTRKKSTKRVENFKNLVKLLQLQQVPYVPLF